MKRATYFAKLNYITIAQRVSLPRRKRLIIQLRLIRAVEVFKLKCSTSAGDAGMPPRDGGSFRFCRHIDLHLLRAIRIAAPHNCLLGKERHLPTTWQRERPR